VARVGGDEFTVILPRVKDEATLRRIGDRIISALEEPIPFEGQHCNISASIGTVWIETGSDIQKDELLSNADIALYASKHAGRAQQTFYSPELRDAANAGVPPAGRAERSTDAA
jgi:diguanylate cyclase (GGDEF)-like protein